MTEKIIAHVDAILGGNEYAELITNNLLTDIDDIDEIFDALEARGYAFWWQNGVLGVYRP